jgi:GT2 family glycosyltransferase
MANATSTAVEPEMTIVIPTYNGLSFLPTCVESTLAECSRLAEPTEVLIVDNGSTDDTIPYLGRVYPQVRVLALEANAGFAEACDLGIRASQGQYCLLFNNDAWFAQGALSNLLAFAKRGSYAFTGPMILNPDGTRQWGPLALDFLGEATDARPGKSPLCVTGAALLIRKADYLELGGFDRRFFAFHEELDLQWRARIWGKRIGYSPEAHVYHIGGGTIGGARRVRPGDAARISGQRLYLGRRNQLASLLMNYSTAALFWVLPFWLLSNVIESAGALLLGHRELLKILSAVVGWNVANRRQTWRLRRSVQLGRVLSDVQMARYFAPPFVRLRSVYRLARSGTTLEVS